jgi:hypothetical protein
MKRLIFAVLALVLLTTGAAVAQTGTTGTTTQTQTGTTAAPTVDPTTDADADRGTANPGDPAEVDVDPGTMDQGVSRVYTGTQGQGTAGVPQGNTLNNNTTGTTTTTGVAPETEQGEGMDVDVDTGSRANGAVDVDVTRTTDADTDASGVNETGETGDMGDNAGAYGDQDTLPSTASDMPLVALIGFAALFAALALRRFTA